MAAWHPLFELSVEHQFFPGGRCPDLELQPSHASGRFLHQAGLLLRRTEHGIVVLAGAERLAALRMHVHDAGNRLALAFKIYSADPHFAGYTLPAAQPGRLLFLDSAQARVDGAGRRLLHAAEYVTETALMAVDAAAIAAALDGPWSPRLPVAVVQVVLSNDAGGLCAEGLDPAARAFWLRFEAGQTYWKYYLMGTLGERPALITDLDQAVAFRRLDSVDFPGQRRAAVFLSDRAIPLRYLPSQRFQLKEQASFGEKILIKRMPNARPGLRQREVVDGQAVLVSEIFINQ
jgi:hypothetical protein